jgi:hypothetical protein
MNSVYLCSKVGLPIYQDGWIEFPLVNCLSVAPRARAWLPTRQPDSSLAWEDLSAEDRRVLTEMLVDKTVIAPHPHKIDKDGRRHYLIRTRSTKTAGATISSAKDRQRRQARLSHPRHPVPRSPAGG